MSDKFVPTTLDRETDRRILVLGFIISDVCWCNVWHRRSVFTTQRYAKCSICRHVCKSVCVCLSHSGIVSKWL